jgi:Na+-translocating ferredoxin:NAD+ oxidoreductase subunit D
VLRSPYISQAPSVSVIMLKVLLALLPAVAAYVWVYGAGILLTLSLASVTALVAEAAMLKLRQRPVLPFLLDGSALLTSWLLALALPPLAPWWLCNYMAVWVITRLILPWWVMPYC